PRRRPVPRRSPSRGPRAPASAPRVAAVAATTAASGERGPLAVGVAVTLMESLANGSRYVSGDCRKVHRLPRVTKPPSQTWRTFLANHLQQVAAADFFVVPTATCRLWFVLVILAHERRCVVHVAVTDHPTAAWTAQQLREAFPWDEAPRYLVHDRDSAFHGWT